MLSPQSVPATGTVHILCPFCRHKDIFLSSPALATTKSVITSTQLELIQTGIYKKKKEKELKFSA